jgi:pyruvate/2-oxoglutarate dehydrogenase complex dihydrolipoamide dehydrogenase (E3) component
MLEIEEVDVVVIGMGPGGEEVASRLAESGLRVIGIEDALVGGECPFWGCIPSKMMIRAANVVAETRRVNGLAGSATVDPDWAIVAARIRAAATDDWDDKVAVDRFEAKGGTLIRGRGSIESPGVVAVGELRFRASRAVVFNTGAHPQIPSIEGLDHVPYWTNHQAIAAEVLPESMIVLGGGAIGVELAQVFHRFGTIVIVVEGGPGLLSRDEPEAGEVIEEVFRSEGITVMTATKVLAVSHDNDRFTLTLDGKRIVEAERLLVATGRSVDLLPLGVHVLGINPHAKELAVDGDMRVLNAEANVCKGVWAVGDVTGKAPFTHMSMYQARIAIASILGAPHEQAEYHAVPHVTFTDPEVGAVGLTEISAREIGIPVVVGRAKVSASARGFIHHSGNAGFIKLIADESLGILVGATSVGPHGGEVLGLLTLAVHERTPLARLRSMIYAYPTFHRGIEDALRDLETNIARAHGS